MKTSTGDGFDFLPYLVGMAVFVVVIMVFAYVADLMHDDEEEEDEHS